MRFSRTGGSAGEGEDERFLICGDGQEDAPNVDEARSFWKKSNLEGDGHSDVDDGRNLKSRKKSASSHPLLNRVGAYKHHPPRTLHPPVYRQ